MKMEDYVKILLLKMLGQSSAITFKSHAGQHVLIKCVFFSINVKKGHRKGLEASNISVSAVCYVSTAPTTIAVGCPYLDHPSPQPVPPYIFISSLRGGLPTTEPTDTGRVILSAIFLFL